MNIQPAERLQKLPAYAFKEINDKVAILKEMAARGEAVAPIDFGVGDPSEPTPDFVIAGLEEAGRKHAATGYPSYDGSLEFRKAAADYMQRRFGVMLDPLNEIASCIGAKEAVFNFPEGFINPGDTVICPSPGYPPYKTGTLFAEGEPYYVPLLEKNDFLVDYRAIPSEVVARAKIIWINYPNSPTGAVAGRKYYEGLIAWAHEHEIIIAADEGCYIDIYFGQKPLSILEVAKEGIVAFYSLSKRNNMTGYRVGFLAGDKAIIDIFKRLKTNIDSGTPSIMQEAAILALNDDAHVSKMRKFYEAKAEILLRALRGMGLKVRSPEATFYIWQKVPEGMSDIEFAKRLLDPKVGIVVTPGSLISEWCEGASRRPGGIGGGELEGVGARPLGDLKPLEIARKINPGAGYVRFALMPTMDEMEEAARRIKGMK